MIFVTVGTHEQGMDRLFIELDRLIEEGVITEKVFAQIGYTNYEPKNFEYKKLIGYDEMDNLVSKSDIIITHGGPGSIFHPLQYGKIPIVVPRNPKYNEHVDNHQILFTKRLEEEKKILAVYEVSSIKEIVVNYNSISRKCRINTSTSGKFIKGFEELLKNKLGLY
ncbi:glycosyltransferase [Clostridium sp.]|uniref:glycosyltransferase n=1 Tax=Clostridium sp. TaxID=1506 RepID=UPI003521BBBE